MKCFKGFFLLVMTAILLALSSCGSHLPKDNYPNPSLHGYHRMEFDIGKDGAVKKEIGIGNIYLKEDQELTGLFFKIYGLYKGTLHMKSDACGINFSTRFDGVSTFKLKDFIQYPTKCSIRITAETDKVKNREHNIVESGVIKLNVIPEKSKPVTIEYSRTNSAIRSLYTTYNYKGQGSIQRQEGDLTSFEKFKVKTDLTQGGHYRIAGCGNVITDTFKQSSFDVSFKNLYARDYLSREDTCDFEIIIIPNEVLETYVGRFSVNIFGAEVVKLEALEWKIKKSWGRKKIYVWGGEHILACSINYKVKTRRKCSKKYKSNETYWVRAITTNARKSVYAIKDNTVIWKE